MFSRVILKRRNPNNHIIVAYQVIVQVINADVMCNNQSYKFIYFKRKVSSPLRNFFKSDPAVSAVIKTPLIYINYFFIIYNYLYLNICILICIPDT